ncbi:hypothetical protein [Burkholderia ubonensis]|uniref:hypothetical protein n=1 Tax=Burkholderia ubonensis TaxID=101571 RepID=UPI000A5612B2|nr:hypothetical protein [Burkholderia ubonensis]
MTEQTGRNALPPLRAMAEQPSANMRVSTLVRQRLSDIEAAQANGYSNTQIVEALNKELGVSIKLKTFEQALWRIRNRPPRKATGSGNATTKPVANPTVTAPIAATGKKAADAKALLGDLAGTPKVGAYSPIPKEGFEIDESEKLKK